MLKKTEYDPYYERYIVKTNINIDIIDGFRSGQNTMIDFFKSIPNEKLDYKYEKNKWSIKEVLQHIIDTERVFMYRCFRIARNDKTPLEGFHQDQYMEPSGAKHKTIDELVNEYIILREGSISLLKSLTDLNLRNIGMANGSLISARACAFIILGHEMSHKKILEEKYL